MSPLYSISESQKKSHLVPGLEIVPASREVLAPPEMFAHLGMGTSGRLGCPFRCAAGLSAPSILILGHFHSLQAQHTHTLRTWKGIPADTGTASPPQPFATSCRVWEPLAPQQSQLL